MLFLHMEQVIQKQSKNNQVLQNEEEIGSQDSSVGIGNVAHRLIIVFAIR